MLNILEIHMGMVLIMSCGGLWWVVVGLENATHHTSFQHFYYIFIPYILLYDSD